MLFRKITGIIESHLRSDSNKIMIVDGARQVGKTFSIRYVGKKLFKNFIELDLREDQLGDGLFADIDTVSDFYLQVSMIAGNRMKEKNDTLIFIDEIQTYPKLLTLLKFLRDDDRYTYIASGSLLGVTLGQTSSIPMGSIEIVRMYPLDFEEFLYANGFNAYAVESLRTSFRTRTSPDENTHKKVLGLFKRYLLAGGLPESVNSYISDGNIVNIRKIQRTIHDFYSEDASKYDRERRLVIRRIYDMIPSTLENRKKRIVVKDIEGKSGKRMESYRDEFDYLINSGIALEVKAVSTPIFPLLENSGGKNLLKLYLNDVGMLTEILYKNNVRAILDDTRSINLGTVYESAVAGELKAHGFDLFYYDNKKNGEVDFLIDDYDGLSVIPIEVKSGKDYNVHLALDHFLSNPEYGIKEGYVLSNEREVVCKNNVIYMPVYLASFFEPNSDADADIRPDSAL